MYDTKKHAYLRKGFAILMTLVMVITYFPQQTFAASSDDWSYAYFRNGSILEGSDGKPYYNDSRRYSNRWYTTHWNIDDNCHAIQGARHAYSLKNKKTGKSYRAYCLEQDVMNPNSGNILYSAKQMEDIKFLKQLSKEQKKGIEFALLYGKQPDVSEVNMIKLLGDGVKGCNSDDWYVATQAIIWEFQQNLRSSVDGIPKNVTMSSIGTKAWRNTPADFFYAPIKNRPAGKVYRAMLRAMREHREIPSFTSGERKKKSPQVIYMEQVGNEYWSVNRKYASLAEAEKAEARTKTDYYYLEDTNDITRELKVMDGKKKNSKFVFQKKKGGKHPQYKLIYKGTTLPTSVQHGKKDIKEATKLDCLAWNVTGGHYQTLAFGADDPVDFYFKLKTKTPLPPGEKEKPVPQFFPEFSWPVHKDDVNSGWDGDNCTGMGDASLGSTFVLKRDGEIVDEVTLDDVGSTDYLYDQPWMDEEDLLSKESGTRDHVEGDSPTTHCTVTPTRIDWDDEATYTIEEIVPDGRHPADFETTKNLPGNTVVRGTYKVKYHCHTIDSRSCMDEPEFWADMDYNIVITDADGTTTKMTGKMGEGDLQYDFEHEFIQQTWINDNYRGDLQIVKTKDDQNPFTDKTNSENGVKDYSTKSKWTIQLKSGGWEDHPYIRVEDEGVKKAAAGEYERYAHVYRVVRDTSGYAADETHPLEVSEDGQLYVYDLPYGTYEVKEISADAEGYVLESFEVIVDEHGQKISKSVNNQAKKNKIKVAKANSETGKIVRWDADRTAFRIRYKGNPDLNDPSTSPNYNKYLPNGSSYTDNADSNYVFYANKNGEIVLPYQIEYGIYEIEELVVPEGYYVGQYDEKGIGSIADMGSVNIIDHQGQKVTPPKSFLETVQVRDENGKKVTEFKGDNKTTYNTYGFTVKEQDPHEDGRDYVTYYAVVDMPNNPVKGKIEISKTGEGLVGWKEGGDGGYSIWKAIWDKITLKDTKFEIYAAKDILQSDGVIPVEAYLSKDNSEIELDIIGRDHADKDDAKETRGKTVDENTTILQVKDKGLIKNFGKANATVTDYIIKALNGATFENTYTVRDNDAKMTYQYTVQYTLNYSKGGFNYTDVHVTKKSVADDYVAEIDVTDPVLKSGDLEIGMVTMNYDNGNMIRMNPLEEEGNVTNEEDIKGTHSAYNTDDITAKPVDPEGYDPKAIFDEEKPIVDEEGNPVLDDEGNPTFEQKTDEDGNPMFTTPLSIVVPAGWDWCKDSSTDKYYYEAGRTDNDGNPVPRMYMVTKGSGEDAEYMLFIKDGDKKRWIPCDAEGNYYKSYYQEYSFTMAQHYKSSEGFTFTWDKVIDLSAVADNDAETTTTIINEPEKAPTPKITETKGIYSHVTENGKTTFTGTLKLSRLFDTFPKRIFSSCFLHGFEVLLSL
ncbi:MAG: Cys-Gln thioester bond-forming surface protein [Emergencia sp.]|nr:Cys-Gln thioester bond-forming surface protein [Emergencia sp.]